MRTVRSVILCIALISILSLTPQRQAASQVTIAYSARTVTQPLFPTVKAQLPSLYVMKRFVTSLIDSYNWLVNQNDRLRKDFDVIKGHFSLYHESGSSFNVTVLQTDSSHDDFITLIFTPIESVEPIVKMNYDDIFYNLFPNATRVFGPDYLFQSNFSSTHYNGTVVRLYFFVEIYLSRLSPSSDYITNANQFAQTIYNSDHSKIPTVSQTQTTTETISQTQTLAITQTTENYGIDWFKIMEIVGFVASVAYLYEKRGSIKSRLQRLMQRLRQSGHEQAEQSEQPTESHNKQD